MTQLGGHAILLRPEQVGIGTREIAGGRRPQPLALGRRASWRAPSATPSSRSWRSRRDDSRDQRPHRPAASVPGDGGSPDDRRALPAQGGGDRLRRRRQQRRELAAERAPRCWASRCALATPATHRPALRVRKRAEPSSRRAAARGSRWTRTRWRRCAAPTSSTPTSGPAWGRRQEAELRRRVFAGLSGERGAARARARGLGDALPAGAPRRRDHRRRARRPAQHRLRPGREPPARPEGVLERLLARRR